MADSIHKYAATIPDKRTARAVQALLDRYFPRATENLTTPADLGALTATELAFVDGVTAGTVLASKAVVVDSNKDVSALRNLVLTNLDAGASGTAGTVDIFPTTASKGKLILSAVANDGDTNVTLTNAAMGQASVISIPDPGAATANVVLTSAANDGVVVTATSAELNYLDIATLGTLAASKAWTSDASLDTVMPTGGKLTVQSGGDITLESGSTLDVAGTFEIANVAVTASAAELNYNDIATLGTLAASKAWTSDASLDTTMPTGGLLTVQSGGAVTFNSGSTLTVDGTTATTVAAAEHGAGAIGTAVAPRTYRWVDRGVIITQTKIDLTGLASVATANDVIGLSAGGAAYIGRNVEATNGIIYKVEFACLETPTGGDNDVNVVANASAVLAYDGAGGTTYLSNSGDLLKGQTIENLLPALTEGDYFYLTAGTGDTAAAYTGGMYLLTTYGHAALS